MKKIVKKITGALLGLSREELTLIGRAGSYIKPYKLRFGLAFLCIISSIGFGLIRPLFFGKSITCLVEQDSEQIWVVLGIMTASFFAQQGITLLQNYLFSFLNEQIIYDVKRDMYRNILEMPVVAFDRITIGEFLSRLNGDSNALASLITNQLLNSLVNILRVIIVGIALFQINSLLFVVVIASLPISFIISIRFGKKLKVINKKLAEIQDSFFSNTQETLAGIREIKGLGIGSSKNEEFLGFSNQCKKNGIKMGILNSVMSFCNGGINFISEMVVLIASFYLIINGELTLELVIAFTSYAMQFKGSLTGVTMVNSALQQAMVSFGRIFEVIDGFGYTREKFGTANINSIKGDIQFSNISFGYKKDRPVLQQISFRIPRKSKVAFVGPSGNGKSTIFNLLLRFYQPDEGDITIDGLPIDTFSKQSLRNTITTIRQEPFLFNISIKENMRLAHPQAGDEEIKQCCKSAFIHDYIESLPEKYDTVIGEQGITFSGGQKQRLAIARGLLKNASIILFDEATSALDNESQYEIKKAVDEIRKERTVLIVAHKLLTVIDADIIYVVKDGMIKGKGTHEELIKTNSVYRKLYKNEVESISQKTEAICN